MALDVASINRLYADRYGAVFQCVQFHPTEDAIEAVFCDRDDLGQWYAVGMMDGPKFRSSADPVGALTTEADAAYRQLRRTMVLRRDPLCRLLRVDGSLGVVDRTDRLDVGMFINVLGREFRVVTIDHNAHTIDVSPKFDGATDGAEVWLAGAPGAP